MNATTLQAVIAHRYEVMAKYVKTLKSSKVPGTIYSMRHDLAAIWARSTAPQEQLVKQLEDWCQRAEASGIEALQQFSRRLRCYA